MEIYKVEAPDGSIIEIEGPEGATDAQIGQAAQAAYAEQQGASVATGQPRQVTDVEIGVRSLTPQELAQSDAIAAQTQAQPTTTATGLAGAATRGLALPAAGALAGAAFGAPFAGVGAIPGAIAGAGAATLAGIVGDPVVELMNNFLGTKYTLPTDALNHFLTKIGVANPDTEAERIVQAISAGAGGAGGIAAAGKAVQAAAAGPVTRAVGGVLASQPVAQVAGGAGAGAGGAIAREMDLGPGAEIAASLVGGIGGGLAGARATAAPRAPAAAPRIQPIIEEAGRRGIPVMTSDVIQPQTFIGKAAQRLGERIPIAGTGPVRAEQQQSRISAVRDLLRDFGADDTANLSDDIMFDLLTKRSAERLKYTGAKGEVIRRLDSKGEVPMPKTREKIDEIVARLRAENTEAAIEAAARLAVIKAGGTTGLSGRSLKQVEAFRRDELANAFKDDATRPISIAARDVGEKAMREIYSPVRQDMGDFIKATGERQDFNKWMVANKRLKENVDELKMNSLKSVLKSGEATPEVVNRLLFSKKPSEINQLYSSLTPVGRATARTSILSQAADKASVELADGTKVFSPEKFNAEIKRLQPQIGVFFKADDLKQVEGLSRVLTLTRRAGEAGVSTATGQEAVPFIAGGALSSIFGSFLGTLVGAGGIGLTARIYESAPVRNLMLQVGKTKPGSGEEAAIAKRLIATIQTQAEAIQSISADLTE